MTRWMPVATLMGLAVSSAVLNADLTITMTNSIDGPMAAMAGGSAPSMTMRIQGMKARSDMDMMGRAIVTLTDVAAKQMLILDPTAKTVRRLTPEMLKVDPNAANGFSMPKMDVTVEPTGQSQQMAGQSCAEFRISTTIDMSQMGGAIATPDARAAMKDMRMVMKGSTWISTSSPAASEFIKFQQAARAAGMALRMNLFGGQNAPDPVAQAVAQAEGLPCLSEVEMDYEGTGPMIDMLKKMGTMKITSRLTEISLTPIAPDIFIMPAGYTETSFQNPAVPRP